MLAGGVKDAECAIDGGDDHFFPGVDFKVNRGRGVNDCSDTWRDLGGFGFWRSREVKTFDCFIEGSIIGHDGD